LTHFQLVLNQTRCWFNWLQWRIRVISEKWCEGICL